MQTVDFQYLANLLKKRSGLALTDDKAYLIESRLLPIARHLGLTDITQLCAHLRQKNDETLLKEVTEAMTTNESSFFRDNKPYEQFKTNTLPMVMEKQAATKRLRIWSAACSTGQEPYSLAICMKELAHKLEGWNCELIATDLAAKVVDKAKQGIYSQFEVQRGLPIQLLVKYFKQLPDTNWQVSETIRGMVQFKLQNLLEDYRLLGRFDIIFCRNVLIYFDQDTKAAITRKMKDSLAPHGVYVIGSTETLVDPDGCFTEVEGFRGAYRLK